MKRFFLGMGMLCLLFFCVTPSTPAAIQYNIVAAGSASPSEVFGVYTENGSLNNHPCYQGPNGYWLYFGLWYGDNYWFVGNVKGETEINNSGVRFYSYSPDQTLPLDTNFYPTNTASGAIKITTASGSPPSTPAYLSNSSATNTSFSCLWADVSDAIGYKLDISTSGDFADFVPGYNARDIVVPPNTPIGQRPTSLVIGGLTPGATYYSRIRAYNGFGESSSRLCDTPITTIPGTPAIQPASNVSGEGFTANWAEQLGANYYKLYVSSSADFSSNIIDGQTVYANYYTITGLSANIPYYYRVKACNGAGESGFSNHAAVTTGPAKPGILDAEGISSNAFTAKWSSSAAASGYYLDVASDSGFTSLVTGYANRNVGNVTSFRVDQGIEPYTTYYVRVRAYNANGISSSSSTQSIMTLAVAATILTVSVSDISTYSAVAVGDLTSLGNPAAGAYGFCWNTTGDPTISDSKTSHGPATTTGTFSDSLDLLAQTPYFIRAYASNEAGTVYGQVESFTTLPANTAPVLNTVTIDLGTVDEDTTTAAHAIGSFLDASDGDLPANSLGIAVNSTSGKGTWQYSSDGISWNSMGAVSSAASLLLASTAQIRYLPDGQNGETAAFTFRVWDGTSGSPETTDDTSINGGSSAYSSTQGTASFMVTAVNDAPVMVATIANLGTTPENINSTPVLISNFLSASDVDLPQNTLGIAIVDFLGHGTWQYSADGSVWHNFENISSANALLLGPNVQIHYIPDGLNGETASILYMAWDGTAGSEFSYADTSVNGGTAAFSAAQATAGLTVTDVNNSPLLISGPFTFNQTDILTPSHPYLVSDIASMSDSDRGALSGIAVYSTTGDGVWQYSTDGVNWNGFTAVAQSASLLLPSTYQVQYLPALNNGETAAFSFRGWDQISGTPGSIADTTTNGGSTAFSGNTQTASIVVSVPVYTISGKVSTTDAGLAGVCLYGLPNNPQTDALGMYTVNVTYGWSGSVSPALEGYTFVPVSCSYNQVNENKLNQNYIATINRYNIEVLSSSLEGGTAVCLTNNGSGVSHGTDVTVAAQANQGHSFVNWTEGGLAVSTNPNYSFLATSNRTLVANFSFNPIQIEETGSDGTLPIILPAGVSFTDVEYQISISDGAVNPKIQLAVTGGIATTPHMLITTPDHVTLDIPSGTEISGPGGWDGTIGLPVVSDTASQSLGHDQFVIKVGLDSGSLNFAEPVQIFAPGQGKKEIKVIRNGSSFNITEVLSSNTIAAAKEKLQGEIIDAKFVNGKDLYIWTKRFCEFVAYKKASNNDDDNLGGSTIVRQFSSLGVTVSFPEYALNAINTVQIERVTDTSAVIPEGCRLISDIFNISSDNEDRFNQPATITLPFDKNKAEQGKDQISLCWYDANVEAWKQLQNESINWEKGTITGETYHAGLFAVMAAVKADAPIQNIEELAEEKEAVHQPAFTDINGHWAQKNILKLAGKGCVAGYPDGSFRLEQTISRAEFAAMLVKAFDLSPQNGKVFNDTARHWGRTYIATANACGIIKGYNEKQFGPDDLLSREQLSVMISLAAKLDTAANELDFTDKEHISDWAVPYVAAASQSRMITGYPNGKFLPQGKATRAEAVTIIVNALGLK